MHMAGYTNQNGENFHISIERGNAPEEANYWGYVFLIKDSSGKEKLFRCMILKTFLERQTDADQFVKGDPLVYINSLLEATSGGSTPLFWPLNMNWIVI